MTNSTTQTGFKTIFSAPSSAPVKETVGLDPNGGIFAQAFFKGILAADCKFETEEEQVPPKVLVRPAPPVAPAKRKRVLPSVGEMRRFKPATTWTPKYDEANQLSGISWQGEPIAVISATVKSSSSAWIAPGEELIKFLRGAFPDLGIDPEDDGATFSIPIDWHYTCQRDGESGHIFRPCRQKTNYRGKPIDKIFFPIYEGEDTEIGREVEIILLNRGDAREGYEDALIYLFAVR